MQKKGMHVSSWGSCKFRSQFDIIWDTGMNERLKIIVTETNRYVSQKGCIFEKMRTKIIAFLGINFIMTTNRLLAVKDYWPEGKSIGNVKEPKRHDKNKVSINLTKSIIQYLNKVFAESLDNSLFQYIDEHVCKFKSRSSDNTTKTNH